MVYIHSLFTYLADKEEREESKKKKHKIHLSRSYQI